MNDVTQASATEDRMLWNLNYKSFSLLKSVTRCKVVLVNQKIFVVRGRNDGLVRLI